MTVLIYIGFIMFYQSLEESSGLKYSKKQSNRTIMLCSETEKGNLLGKQTLCKGDQVVVILKDFFSFKEVQWVKPRLKHFANSDLQCKMGLTKKISKNILFIF